MSSLTNVWFPPAKADLLREAIKHYQFDGPAAFFRICGHILIDHYERRDPLSLPLEFSLYANTKETQQTNQTNGETTKEPPI